MARRRAYRAISRVDPKALAEFQAGIRKRYSDDEILRQLKSCAERLGRSPTMREFSDDAESTIHPQTVIERFGSWNRAKRAAGLVPRRFATKEELLRCLRELGEKLGRTPTAKDVDTNRGLLPSKSLYWYTFGSFTNALREAGFDSWDDFGASTPLMQRVTDSMAGRAALLQLLPFSSRETSRVSLLRGGYPEAVARRADPRLLSEWQVYRMFDARRGAWSMFQFLVRDRLLERGIQVGSDGALGT